MTDDLVFQIARLELSPGDVLVVKTEGHASHDVMSRLVPPGVKILYIDNDVELSVLTKADIESRAR